MSEPTRLCDCQDVTYYHVHKLVRFKSQKTPVRLQTNGWYCARCKTHYYEKGKRRMVYHPN